MTIECSLFARHFIVGDQQLVEVDHDSVNRFLYLYAPCFPAYRLTTLHLASVQLEQESTTVRISRITYRRLPVDNTGALALNPSQKLVWMTYDPSPPGVCQHDNVIDAAAFFEHRAVTNQYFWIPDLHTDEAIRRRAIR